MQSDFGTINPNTKSGGALADDLNDWRDAVHTSHLGSARPGYVKPGMIWILEVTGTLWELYLAVSDTRDARIGQFDPTIGSFNLTCQDAFFTAVPAGPDADPGNDNDLARKKYVDNKVSVFISSGTRMLFVQSNTPPGWTKDTSPGLNHALRITGGTAGWGGSMGFTGAFGVRGLSGYVDNTTLADWQMPLHKHSNAPLGNILKLAADSLLGYSQYSPNGAYIGWGTLADTDYAGSGGGHGHGLILNNLDMSVAYVDAILGIKD